MKNTSYLKLLLSFLVLISLSFSQQISVFGNVNTPMNGMLMPIEGAIIQNNYMNSAGVTDENGNYEWWVYLMPNANHVTLQCLAEGYQTQNFVLEFDPNQTEYEVNFTLEPATNLTSVLSGQVTQNNGCLGGPLGCPIVGAVIEAVPLNSPLDIVYFAESNVYGFYEIELPIGGYSVVCTADGWEEQSMTVEVGSNGGQAYFSLTPLESEEIFLEGHVFNALSSSALNQPIGDALVLLHNNNGEILTETHTAQNGYYSFGEIAQSASHISISAEGYEEFEAEVSFEDCNAFVQCYPLEINAYLNPLDDFMLNGLFHGNVSAQFSPMGPVMPLSGSTILIHSYTNVGTVETYETHSNEGGYFSIELPENTYMATCHANVDDYPFEPLSFDFQMSHGHEVEHHFHFNSFQTEVEPPVDLVVTVVDNPLGGTAHLSWEYPFFTIPEIQVHFNVYFNNDLTPNNQWDLIGETSELSFEMILGDFVQTTGCFKVTAEMNGEESPSSNVACIGNNNQDGVIYGYVTYFYGDIAELVSGALITVQGMNTGTINQIEYETHTNENGIYELAVPAGAYLVTATIEDGQTETHDVYVNAGHEEMVNFDFYSEVNPEIFVEGNVYCLSTTNNCVVNNGIIHIYSNGLLVETLEFHDGHFAFMLPYPGHYGFDFIAEGFETVEMEMFIEHSMSFEVGMTPVNNEAEAYLIAGSLTASPMDTIRIPLYLESSTSFAGLQFMANTDQMFYPLGFESTIECFTTNFGEVYGQLFGLMFSLEGCVLEAGEHHLADMLFTISPWTETFGEVEINLVDIIVSDADANQVPTEGISGTVQLGLKGDVNGDNALNVLDIVSVVNIILMNHEPTDYEYWASDMNEDGNINVLDVVSIINSILLIPMDVIDYNFQNAEIKVDDKILILTDANIAGLQLKIDNNLKSTNFDNSWTISNSNDNFVIYNLNLQTSENIEIQFENSIEHFELLLSDVNGNEINYEISEIPSQISLNQNYPNPFNPSTNINFTLNDDMDIQLNIYDTNGKLIEQLVNGFYHSGEHNINWNSGNNLSSGIYIYELITPNKQISSKMILMK